MARGGAGGPEDPLVIEDERSAPPSIILEGITGSTTWRLKETRLTNSKLQPLFNKAHTLESLEKFARDHAINLYVWDLSSDDSSYLRSSEVFPYGGGGAVAKKIHILHKDDNHYSFLEEVVA
jgi:hypothetical protein